MTTAADVGEQAPPPFRVAVVLPMYNEAGNVVPLLERLQEVRTASGLDLYVVAVEDGSQDATLARVNGATNQFPFLRVVAHVQNRGMAAAIRTGIETVLSGSAGSFDAVAFMDADLTHDPSALPSLLKPIMHGGADFVLGSRYVPGGGMRDVPFVRRAISVGGNAVGRLLLGVSATDLTTGFRAARPAVFQAVSLREPGFGIQLEGVVKAHYAGFRIAEVPVVLGTRRHGHSKMVYNRAFWLGYGRLFVRLLVHRAERAVRSVRVRATSPAPLIPPR